MQVGQKYSTAGWDSLSLFHKMMVRSSSLAIHGNLNETAYQADNTKGWKGTKRNVDGTAHSTLLKLMTGMVLWV